MKKTKTKPHNSSLLTSSIVVFEEIRSSYENSGSGCV